MVFFAFIYSSSNYLEHDCYLIPLEAIAFYWWNITKFLSWNGYGYHHYYKMWVQFTSPHSLDHWIHYFFIGPHSLQLVNSLKIQWNHLAYKDTFCCCALHFKFGDFQKKITLWLKNYSFPPQRFLKYIFKIFVIIFFNMLLSSCMKCQLHNQLSSTPIINVPYSYEYIHKLFWSTTPKISFYN